MSLSNMPAPSGPAATLLVLSPFREDYLALRNVLTDSGASMPPHACIRGVHSVPEALGILRRTEVPIVICESELPDGNWQDVVRQAADLACPPRVIVMSRVADDHLWAAVLELGGYDLLPKPFDPPEARRVIALAWAQWRHGSRARAAGA